MGLELGVGDQHGVPVLTLDGDVDLSSAADLREQLLATLAGSPARVVIDLSAVGFLDSTGLGALATGLERAADTGTVLAVVCPPALRRLFKITGLDSVLVVADSLNDAVGPAGGSGGAL